MPLRSGLGRTESGIGSGLSEQEKSRILELIDEHEFVFISGLHRSGTTLASRDLRRHPAISGYDVVGAKVLDVALLCDNIAHSPYGCNSCKCCQGRFSNLVSIAAIS